MTDDPHPKGRNVVEDGISQASCAARSRPQGGGEEGWRRRCGEALSDAVARGWASRDDYDRAPTYLGVGVKIEEAPDAKKRRTP